MSPYVSSRFLLTESSELLCQKLTHRRILRISGPDRWIFLQGLVTNDVAVLECATENTAMYAMMLNVKGRVMYDLVLYRCSVDTDSLLVECNEDISAELLKTLAKFKLRKKLTLSDAGHEVDVWSVFSKEFDVSDKVLPPYSITQKDKALLCLPDPRLPMFAYRLLTQHGVDGASVVSQSSNVSDVYDVRRYQLGLSEGTSDLPPGECLPLESNLEFLRGVSFDKGCYVGQELTARTQYTGVIRKRLMPIVFLRDVVIKPGATLETSAGKPCGKLRSSSGRYGLGLLRVEEVVAGKGPLIVREGNDVLCEAETHLPRWWNPADEVVKKTITRGPEPNVEV